MVSQIIEKGKTDKTQQISENKSPVFVQFKYK